MYRKAIACIEQSAHEQLSERDCRCMRIAEKSVHTFSPTLLCHYCMSVNYITEIQVIVKDDFEKGNGLAPCYLLPFSWNYIILITSCKDNT